MTSERYVIDWRDGWLCIRFEGSEFFTPTLTIHWWPVRREARADVERFIGLTPARGHAGFFSVADPWYPGGRRVDLTLKDGGSTQPIATESRPLPCPKVRAGIETRYEAGRWRKYLKAKGWVDA
jgi:hypothetical protein